MLWISWSLLVVASGLSTIAAFLGASERRRASTCTWLVVCSGLLAATAMILGLLGKLSEDATSVPLVLSVGVSVVFAISFGGPFTELIFRFASRGNDRSAQIEDPSPLRGGLWIGLLERTAIVASLWASWPEGIAVVLAVKGLGRFAELKNHQAAEQFILGTFSSGLVATGAYGLGLLLN